MNDSDISNTRRELKRLRKRVSELENILNKGEASKDLKLHGTDTTDSESGKRNTVASDTATNADLTEALEKLREEIEERTKSEQEDEGLLGGIADTFGVGGLF